MTLHGTEAGMDYGDITCPHGTTAESIDPPVGGTFDDENARNVDRAIDALSARHRAETGCDCERLVSMIAGPRQMDA